MHTGNEKKSTHGRQILFSVFSFVSVFVVVVVVFVLYGGVALVEALGKGKQPEKVKQQHAYIDIHIEKVKEIRERWMVR
jgi:hypothetical protein